MRRNFTGTRPRVLVASPARLAGFNPKNHPQGYAPRRMASSLGELPQAMPQAFGPAGMVVPGLPWNPTPAPGSGCPAGMLPGKYPGTCYPVGTSAQAPQMMQQQPTDPAAAFWQTPQTIAKVPVTNRSMRSLLSGFGGFGALIGSSSFSLPAPKLSSPVVAPLTPSYSMPKPTLFTPTVVAPKQIVAPLTPSYVLPKPTYTPPPVNPFVQAQAPSFVLQKPVMPTPSYSPPALVAPLTPSFVLPRPVIAPSSVAAAVAAATSPSTFTSRPYTPPAPAPSAPPPPTPRVTQPSLRMADRDTSLASQQLFGGGTRQVAYNMITGQRLNTPMPAPAPRAPAPTPAVLPPGATLQVMEKGSATLQQLLQTTPTPQTTGGTVTSGSSMLEQAPQFWGGGQVQTKWIGGAGGGAAPGSEPGGGGPSEEPSIPSLDLGTGGGGGAAALAAGAGLLALLFMK